MYLNITVATPPVGNGISYKPIKGTKYVYYEHGRRYDSERGYTVPQTTSIGKIYDDDGSLMYPNANYLKFFPESELSEELPVSVRSGCLKIGDYLVIKKVIEHYKLDVEISAIIGKDAGRFLDLAAYTIVAENNAAQYYPDYAYNYPLFTDEMKIFSDSKISSFLREITRDDSIRFLNDWNARRRK